MTDDGVLTALETVDRGVFVAPHLSKMVAEDCALPIPCGQSIPRPIVTAKLLRALQISPGKEERVLLIGSGSGYTAALLSQICRHVYGIERYERLVEQSRKRLEELAVENVTIRHGNGLAGMQEHGPYDRILLAGAVKTIPAVLIEQLAKGRFAGNAHRNELGAANPAHSQQVKRRHRRTDARSPGTALGRCLSAALRAYCRSGLSHSPSIATLTPAEAASQALL